MRRSSADLRLPMVALLALGLLSFAFSSAGGEAFLPIDLAIALDAVADEANATSPEVTEPCASATEAEQVELGGPITIKASCTADCGSAPDVTCSGSGSCTAVDRNCGAGQRGYVTCGSTTNYCPSCGCTEGAIRYTTGSGCCCDYTIEWAPVSRRKLITEKCINGFWVYQGFSCSGQNCGGPPCPV